MVDEIISLTKKFVAIESTAKNTVALDEILELALSQVKGCTIERFESHGIKSALVYRAKHRPRQFKIILNVHLDVIPAKSRQYLPRVQHNRLYGSGTMDMKANAACLISTFVTIVRQVDYPLGLQLVTDEEIGGLHGTKYQVDSGVRADFVIAGETTNFRIVNKTKGIIWAKISSIGKTAHSAYPWEGENAICKMNEFLNNLAKRYSIGAQKQWVTTVSVSSIETSNQTFNKIPDGCTAWLDIRYIPEETDMIIENIKALLPPDFTLQVVLNEPAQFVADNNHHIKLLQKIAQSIVGKKVSLYEAHGSSDTRHFAQVDCAGIEFGAIGGGIGTDSEWIDIPSLEKYQQIIKAFLLAL